MLTNQKYIKKNKGCTSRRNHFIAVLNYGNNLNPQMEIYIIVSRCLFQLEMSNNKTYEII